MPAWTRRSGRWSSGSGCRARRSRWTGSSYERKLLTGIGKIEGSSLTSEVSYVCNVNVSLTTLASWTSAEYIQALLAVCKLFLFSRRLFTTRICYLSHPRPAPENKPFFPRCSCCCIILRIMESFAVRYHEENPGVFSCSDTAWVLAFGLMMLNTDMYNRNIKVGVGSRWWWWSWIMKQTT